MVTRESPPLTSWVGTRSEAVTTALRELVGASETIPLVWSVRTCSDEAVALHVQLTLGEHGTLDIDLGTPGTLHRPKLARRTYAVGLRTPPSTPASRVALGRRVIATIAARADTEDLAAGLWAAVREHAALTDVSDWMFRQVTGVGAHKVGNLRLGFRCNQDCGFCWQDRSWPGAPDALYTTWLDELAAQGIASLIITGGEPTLFRGLVGLVERATQHHGLRVQLQTNAVQLRRESLAVGLAKAGVDGLFVSLHSVDAGISDQLTRAPGTWAHTMAGIANALAAGIHVDLNALVNADTVGGLPQHAKTIVDRFVTPASAGRVGSVTYSFPAPSFDAAHYHASLVPLDEVRVPLSEAIGTLASAGVTVDVGGTCGFPPCVYPDHVDAVRSLHVADVGAWDRTDRVFVEPCDGCSMRARCLGLRRGYVERFGARGVVPIP